MFKIGDHRLEKRCCQRNEIVTASPEAGNTGDGTESMIKFAGRSVGG